VRLRLAPRLRAVAALLLLALALPARAQTAGAVADEGVPEEAGASAIRIYQRYVSDLRHARCRFTPSCSEYASLAIARYGLIDGSARAADRLMRCNASAVGAYPRGEGGTLRDPVGDEPAPSAVVWVPAWLRLESEPARPPLADTLDVARLARLEETVAFALLLEQRGDRGNAAIEYQRAALLAGSREAHAWAFNRIGEAAARAGDALGAERAYLSAAMLSEDGSHRARAVYRAAIGRFESGSFAACERLLGDRTLIAIAELSDGGSGGAVGTRPGAAQVEVLAGMAEFGLGDWESARGRFSRAAAVPGIGDTLSRRIETLAGFVPQGPRLPHRSPALARTLSAIVPGSGQMYSGRGADGLRHMLFNAALITTAISFARGEHVPAAILTGSLAVPFYVGNIRGAGNAARRHDRDGRVALLRSAIEATGVAGVGGGR